MALAWLPVVCEKNHYLFKTSMLCYQILVNLSSLKAVKFGCTYLEEYCSSEFYKY